MKKIICVIISMLLLLLTSAPSFADVKDLRGRDCSYMDPNTVVEDISIFENTVVYYYSNDVLRICATYNAQTHTFDFAKYYIGSDSFTYTSGVTCERIDTDSIKTFANELSAQEFAKVPVRSVIFESSISNPKSIPTADYNKIHNAMVSGGMPNEYTDHNTRVIVVSGISVVLRDSLSYDYNYSSCTTMVINTVLSVVCAVLGLSSGDALAIASFALALNGLYELVQTVKFKRYNVIAHYIKNAYISNVVYNNSWENLTWLATLGDIGATLSYDSGVCDQYYNNDNYIAYIAYCNHRDGYIPPY
ncbi:MAG: hypothetical protein IKO51_00185 [Clostridia bacterium]|nr:hypothetical protein [Clostridia bacterium]